MRARLGIVLLCAVFALCGSSLPSACGPVSHALPPREAGVDLLDRFGIAREGTAAAVNSQSLRRHEWVTRRGRRLATTTLLAPVAIRAGLAGLSGRFTVKLLAAPLFNVGDGVQMEVFAGSAGDRRLVCSRYFDPGRLATDRDWIPLAVPVDLSGAVDSYLEIRVSAGPQGNLDADWLALAEVRIVPEKAAL
jgi:hypothetical protein